MKLNKLYTVISKITHNTSGLYGTKETTRRVGWTTSNRTMSHNMCFTRYRMSHINN